MTPTQARDAVDAILRPSLIDGGWYVNAARERRCCWDPTCTKPRHAIGGKICVQVYPIATTPENVNRLPEIERALLAQLDQAVRTGVVSWGDPKGLRPQVYVWLG
jgi:hypothetical protein